MAVIESVDFLTENTFLLELSGASPGTPGQFYMLRPTDADAPFLPRPISLFRTDARTGHVTLLIETVGEGTRLLSRRHAGDTLTVTGPLGNGFPQFMGDTVLIGGAAGCAPLYELARSKRLTDPGARITAFLGFAQASAASQFLFESFRTVCDLVTLNIGGFVTDDADYTLPAVYYACGPDAMMRAAHSHAAAAGAELYVSLDERMACGVGACLGCTVKTRSGNRRACKDGPVFLSSEVYDV